MILSITKIICSSCNKEHSTKEFELVGNFGECKFEKNNVYLHDTGCFEVNCECGYRTAMEKSFR